MAVVLVGITILGIIGFGSRSRPVSAFTEINEAAIATAGHQNGRITTNVKIRQATGVNGTARIEVSRAFHGDDEQVTVTTDGIDGLNNLEHRRVDGVGFIRLADGAWSLDDIGLDDDLDALVGARPSQGDASTMVRIIRLADDLAKTERRDPDRFDDESTTIYRGTVARTDLVDLPAASLPLGISLVADTPSGLSDELPIEVILENETLVQVDLSISGRTSSGGFIDANIITSYGELGSAPPIDAPSAEDIVVADNTLLARSAMDEQTAFETLSELAERRPDLCRSPDIDADLADGTDRELATYAERLSDCYRAAGELAAADAVPVLILGPAPD